MEKMRTAVSRALSNGRSEPRAADSELPPLVSWIWQQLVAMYGGAVLTAYGVEDKPHKLWVGALSKLTADEAKRGIAALAKERRSYPPNLTEVLAACKPPKQVRYLGGPSSMAKPGLPPPKASVSIAEKYLANMRTLFGRTKPEVKRTLPPEDGEVELLSGSALHDEKMRQLDGLLALKQRMDEGKL